MGYRILIADDEEKVVKLILKLGNWDELNIDVVATCADGEETFRRIQELQPDIVLTDIKMPIYDGIQLIEMTQEAGIHAHFIVLSGYKHFEYAHNAIRLGVVDYLLKPLDAEQLNKALEKACLMIDTDSRNEQTERELENYHKQGGYQKLFELLHDEETELPIPMSNEECNQLYMTSFQHSRYRCLWISTDLGMLLDKNQSLFLDKMQESIPKIFDGSYCWTAVNNRACVILLLNYPREEQGKVRQNISALYYSLKNQAEIYGDFTLLIGVSEEKNHVRCIREAAAEASTAEWGHLVLHGVSVLDYTLLQDLPRFSIRSILSEQDEEKLVNAVRFFQRETVADLFRFISGKAEKYHEYYPGDMADFLRYLTKAIITVHTEGNVTETLNGIHDELYVLVKPCRHIQDAIKLLYTYVDKWLCEKLAQLQSHRNRPIEEARRYIEANCMEPLSLGTVAETVHLSPAYFSKLFKSELGIGFSEYLVNVRMKKSQELLLRTDDSIRSIAERVGYPDEKYFCRLFKKQVGIKPSEYRKLYLGK